MSKLVYRFNIVPNITIHYEVIVIKATFKSINGQGHNFLISQRNRTENLKQTCTTLSRCQRIYGRSLWKGKAIESTALGKIWITNIDYGLIKNFNVKS